MRRLDVRRQQLYKGIDKIQEEIGMLLEEAGKMRFGASNE
jgi:hypothetical protein